MEVEEAEDVDDRVDFEALDEVEVDFEGVFGVERVGAAEALVRPREGEATVGGTEEGGGGCRFGAIAAYVCSDCSERRIVKIGCCGWCVDSMQTIVEPRGQSMRLL